MACVMFDNESVGSPLASKRITITTNSSSCMFHLTRSIYSYKMKDVYVSEVKLSCVLDSTTLAGKQTTLRSHHNTYLYKVISISNASWYSCRYKFQRLMSVFVCVCVCCVDKQTHTVAGFCSTVTTLYDGE